MGTEYANEKLTWRLLVGGGLILLANVALQLGAKKMVPDHATALRQQ